MEEAVSGVKGKLAIKIYGDDLRTLEAKGDDEILVGRQAGSHPFLVLYTDDCHATIRELEGSKVETRKPPAMAAGATFAHIADLYGNELVIVQLERITPAVTQAIRARGR